jgi:hypothetical protein
MASSFNARLRIDNQNYQVVNFNYSVNRDYDHQGIPSSRLKNSLIDLEIEIPDGDVLFIKWMCQSEIKDGFIAFDKIDMADSAMYRVSFAAAYCISYKQVLASGPHSLTVHVKISASDLTFTAGSQEFSNQFFPHG